eukprot:9602399-Alexandrium_andersonii.AAC.1
MHESGFECCVHQPADQDKEGQYGDHTNADGRAESSGGGDVLYAGNCDAATGDGGAVGEMMMAVAMAMAMGMTKMMKEEMPKETAGGTGNGTDVESRA